MGAQADIRSGQEETMERLRMLARDLKEHQKIIKTTAVIMIIIAAVLFYGQKGNIETIRFDGEEEASAQSEETKSAAQAPVIYVDIGGAVKKPGVYKMDPGSRVFEVIDKAGGLTRHADTAALNQAEEVTDGQKLWIPSNRDSPPEGEGVSAGSSANGKTASSGTVPSEKININTADAAALQQISGIGPVTAQKIIDYRTLNGNFESIEEITNVSGIGDKTFAKIKERITV